MNPFIFVSDSLHCFLRLLVTFYCNFFPTSTVFFCASFFCAVILKYITTLLVYVKLLLLLLVLLVVIVESLDTFQFLTTKISIAFDSVLWLEFLYPAFLIKLVPSGEALEHSVPTACLSPWQSTTVLGSGMDRCLLCLGGTLLVYK